MEVYLPKNKKILLHAFLSVISQLIHRGEMMKAFILLHSAPATIEDEEEVLNALALVKERLGKIASFQRYGTWEGMYNSGFVLPINPQGIPKLQKLQEKLKKLSIKTMVDVGCYSGWLGRELSLQGIRVHGIDVHPVVLQIAALTNAGSLCSFEFLSGEKLGFSHPRKFDGAVLFDVLEHSFDPLTLIKSVNRSVKKGGWVFLSIPSVEGEELANIHELEEHEHLYSFTKKHLEEMLPGAIIETIYENGYPGWFVSYQV